MPTTPCKPPADPAESSQWEPQAILATLKNTAPNPIVPVHLFGKVYNSLIDSGNMWRNCISEELYLSLPKAYQKLHPTPMDGVKAANGSTVEVLGQVSRPLPLIFAKKTAPLHTYLHVVKNLSVPINLGASFMTHFGVILDLANKRVTIDGQTHELSTKPLKTVSAVHTVRRYAIGPHQSKAVRLWVKDRGLRGLPGVVDGRPPDESREACIFMRDSYVTPRPNGELLVLVANPTDQPVVIPKGTCYGDFTPGERVEITQPGVISQLCRQAQDSASELLSSLAPRHLKRKADEASRDAAAPVTAAVVKDRLRLHECNHLSPAQLQQLVDLCLEFQDCFSWDGRYGATDLVTHRIPLKEGAKPVRDRYRPLNPLLEERLYEQLRDWLAQDVIEACVSDWNAALVPVRKKNGDVRFCLDFRKLNDLTEVDLHPIGEVNDLLSRLKDSDMFSTLDNIGAYHAVSIAEEDRNKTAFATPFGVYCFKRMCFGLSTAPASYAKLAAKVLFDQDAGEGSLGRLCPGVLPYLDDTIIHSKGYDAHLRILRNTFEKFRRANLKLSPDKCDLAKKSLKFLGHIITDKGLRTCPDYVKAISEWKCPNTRALCRAFYGKVSYYRRFIPDFAAISAPIVDKLKDDGTRDNAVFEPSPEFRDAFASLKRHLTRAPILAYPDFDSDEPFILDTDYSSANRAAGAVLSQVQNGQERVIAYGSIRLSPTQANYDAHKGELAAFLIFCKKWKYYLQLKRFLFRTDCQALKYIRSQREIKQPFARWMETLATYRFDIQHRSRNQNRHADALSKVDHAGEEPCFTDWEEEDVLGALCPLNSAPALVPAQHRFREMQLADPTLRRIIQLKGENGRPTEEEVQMADHHSQQLYQLYGDMSLDAMGRLVIARTLYSAKPHQPNPVSLLVVPQDGYRQVIKALHEAMGHQRRTKLLPEVQRRFFILRAREAVDRVLQECTICQQAGGRLPPQRSHFFPMLAGYPFQTLSIDFVTNLPKVNGYSCLFTVKCTFSRWVEAFPVRGATTAAAIKKLKDEIFPRYALPDRIHCDNGTHFTSFAFRDFCARHHIDLVHSPPYEANSNTVERAHRDLKSLLTKANLGNKRTWIDNLPAALFVLRTGVNQSINASPFEVLFGQPPTTPLDLLYRVERNTHQPRDHDTIAKMHQWARDHLQRYVRRKRSLYNQKHRQFAPGTQVWLFTPRPSTQNSRKFATYWTGPWTIAFQINETQYKLNPHTTWANKRHPRASIDRLKPYVVAEGEEADPAATAPAQDDDFDIPGDEYGEDVGADSLPDFSAEHGHNRRDEAPEPPESLGDNDDDDDDVDDGSGHDSDHDEDAEEYDHEAPRPPSPSGSSTPVPSGSPDPSLPPPGSMDPGVPTFRRASSDATSSWHTRSQVGPDPDFSSYSSGSLRTRSQAGTAAAESSFSADSPPSQATTPMPSTAGSWASWKAQRDAPAAALPRPPPRGRPSEATQAQRLAADAYRWMGGTDVGPRRQRPIRTPLRYANVLARSKDLLASLNSLNPLAHNDPLGVKTIMNCLQH